MTNVMYKKALHFCKARLIQINIPIFFNIKYVFLKLAFVIYLIFLSINMTNVSIKKPNISARLLSLRILNNSYNF